MPHKILKVPKDGMIEGFNAALAARGIEADQAQLVAARRLQGFYDELLALKAARRSKLRNSWSIPSCRAACGSGAEWGAARAS